MEIVYNALKIRMPDRIQKNLSNRLIRLWKTSLSTIEYDREIILSLSYKKSAKVNTGFTGSYVLQDLSSNLSDMNIKQWNQ